MRDYYKILGVSKSASAEEIKKAYYKLAHKYHPSRKDGNEKKFKEINEAYQILSNKEKRNQYDRFGQVFERGKGFGPGFDHVGRGFDFQWAWTRPGIDFEFDLKDLGDMMEELFSFDSQREKRDLKKGGDIKIDVEISLEDCLQEKKKEINLRKYIPCSRCQGKGAEPGTKIKECFSCRGTGRVQQIKKTFFGSYTRYIVCPECKGEGNRPEKLCNVCGGEGRIRGEEKIEIQIPAGIDLNQLLIVQGKGDAGKRGAKSGDLYVRILIKPHPLFKRKGDDLYCQLATSFSQAALGDEVEVPSLDKKKIILKIPPGSQSGKILRISGKGIPHFGRPGRGNLYVKLEVKIPKKLTKKQKELLEKLKEEGI